MAPATMRFETHANLPTEDATLIEGLPGHGMVASIAVEQIVEQLDMTHAASVESDAYFPILTYRDGGLQDAVRVYAHADASLLSLMSDTAIPPDAFPALGETLVGELATRLSRAIFLVEVPTERGTEDGVVTAVGSTDDLRSSLLDASITIEREEGLLIGPTGALASAFYHAGVPTVVLLVKTGLDPFVPDPGGAKTLIDEALEPLVDFAIDTTPLAARAEAIRADMQSMATQLKHFSDGTGFVESTYDSMYQ